MSLGHSQDGPSLRALQQSLLGAIAGGADPTKNEQDGIDPGLLRVIGTRAPLGAAARVAIYRRMYWLRVVDVLYGDYPRTAALLGDADFQRLARTYLARTPSRHPSLRHAGRGFAAFVGARPEGVPPFLADLARLEWNRVEVFDAPDATPLGVEELRAIPPAEWPGLAFRLIPAFEIMHAGWPVHAIWADEGAAGSAGGVWQSAATVLRVWRKDFLVYQASMDALERLALERLQAGATFAAICAALATHGSAEDAAREAGSLLLRWVEDGILQRVDSRADRA
jgi:hypothetical protein